MYQQATVVLPFAATLWKDVKFNDVYLLYQLSSSVLCFAVLDFLCLSFVFMSFLV